MAISEACSSGALLACPTLLAASAGLARAPGNNSGKLQKAATDFEALLVGQMLRSAREASGAGLTSAEDDDTEANSSLLELGEQQFAQALAASGALGIGKMVVAGLKNAN